MTLCAQHHSQHHSRHLGDVIVAAMRIVRKMLHYLHLNYL